MAQPQVGHRSRHRAGGYCLMIGGEKEPVEHLGPLFKTIAPGSGSAEPTPSRTRQGGTAPHGYLHCGLSDAEHFVKWSTTAWTAA